MVVALLIGARTALAPFSLPRSLSCQGTLPLTDTLPSLGGHFLLLLLVLLLE